MAKNVIEFVIQGVDKGSAPVGKFSKSLGGIIKGVAKFSAVTIAGATAVTLFTERVANNIDKQRLFAQRIGASVATLTAYQYAADISGISTEQFNMATQRMTRRVAEAAQGIGEGSGALRELGIDAKAFNNIGLDQQMQVLADKMSAVENPAERLRLAFKLFDSEGTAMLQMLGEGSEEMRRLTMEAERLGLVVGPQLAANTERFQQAMGKAKGAVTGMSRGIAGELMPIIGGLAEMFADFIADNREGIMTWVREAIVHLFTLLEVGKQVFTTLANAVDKLFTIDGFVDMISNIGTIVGEFGSWFVNTIIEMGQSVGPILVRSFEIAFSAIGQIGKLAFMELFDTITGNNVVDAAEEIKAVMRDSFASLVAETSPFIEDFKTSVTAAGSTIAGTLAETFGVNLDQARAMAEQMISSISVFGEVAAEETDKALSTTRTFMDELSLLNEEFLSTQGTMQKQVATGLFETMMNGVQAVSAGIAEAVMTGGSMMDMLRNVGKQVLGSLIQMLIQIGLQRLITSAISSAAEVSTASAELSSGIAVAGVNAFASTAAIPIVGPILAPAAAAAAIAGATSTAATGMAVGKGMAAGVAHGGMTNVPSESTFLLNRGERVLSPRQNTDLTSFLNNQRQGGGEMMGDGVLTVEGVDPDKMYSGRQFRRLTERLARTGSRNIRFKRK